jgi:glutamate synthase (NADPH/NADH) large chain
MVDLHPVLSSEEQEATVNRAIWHTVKRGVEAQTHEAILKGLIERHFKYTGSTRARNLLDDWANARGKFVKVFPTEYKRALAELNAGVDEQEMEQIAA